jgi:YggT family protein
VHILHVLILVYLLVLGARAVTSWFPAPHSGPLATVNQILRDLTEPVVGPVRRVIPPAGMFDLSFTVVFFVFLILYGATNR